MKKILFISEYAGFLGGIEQYAYDMATILKQMDYEVTLLYRYATKEFNKFVNNFACHTDSYDVNVDYDYIIIHKCHDLKLMSYLLKNHQEKLVAIVHDHELYCPRKYFYTPFKRTNCSRKYNFIRCSICSMMVSPKQYKRGVLNELKSKTYLAVKLLSFYRQIPKVIVLSQFMKDNLLRNNFSNEQLILLHPFIKSEYNVVEDRNNVVPVIGFIGQLIRGKGCDLLLDAIAGVKQPYKLIVAGSGNDEDWLKAKAKQDNLNVEFLGFSHDVGKIYARCNLVVMPSRWQEPFGLVGIEAFCYRLPVIAYNVGGISEWLKRDDLLIEYNNSEALREAITKLLSSPELCQEIGNENYNYVTLEFSKELFIKNLQNILD